MHSRTMTSSMARGSFVVAALLVSALVRPSISSAARLGPSTPPTSPPTAQAPAEPTGDDTSEPNVGPTTGPLRVTVDPAIDDATLVPKWIADRNPSLAPKLAAPDHEQWVAVQIGGVTYDYRITVTPMRDGVAVGPEPTAVTCECNSQELLERVDQEIAKAVQQIQSASAAPEPEPEPQPEPEPEPEPEPRKRLSGLGIAGVVTGSVGIAALAGGVTMVVLGERDVGEPDYVYIQRDFRPPGYAALSVGAAALIAGATMLALDLRCRRNPGARGCSSKGTETARAAARPRFSAILAPGTTGLAVRGRF